LQARGYSHIKQFADIIIIIIIIIIVLYSTRNLKSEYI